MGGARLRKLAAVSCAVVLSVAFAWCVHTCMSHAVSLVAADVTQRMSAAALDEADGARAGDYAVVPYVSELVAASGEEGVVSALVSFDDAWFLADPGSYNGELAATCAALSAACNSQSLCDEAAGRAYAVEALDALGFGDVDTRSYEGRSSVVDEVANIVEGETDVVAYVLASKNLFDGRGRATGHLVFVGVRGTYGSEWLSNFNFDVFPSEQSPANHRGFESAASEVYDALADYLDAQGLSCADTRVLICGHSRGGAVANLLAARIMDEAADREGRDDLRIDPRGVFTYTFASPNSTRDPQRDGARYSAIFNVASLSDVVPCVPFSSWGYGVYGTVVELPAASRGLLDPVAVLASHTPDSYFMQLRMSTASDLVFCAR